MDVIACQRAGVAAVATMGTALTEEQMEVLWRLHREPTLCFDGDRAGRAAAFRAIDRALPLLTAGRSFKFAAGAWRQGPRRGAARGRARAALKAQLADTVAFVELLFVRERDAEPLDTPERRAGLRQRLRGRRRHDRRPRPRRTPTARSCSGASTHCSLSRRRPSAGDWRRRAARLPRPRSAPHRRRPRRGPAPRPRPRTAGRRAGQLRARRPRRAGRRTWTKLGARGFGDPALADLASEIIRLRLEADRLDTGALERHLAARGFSALLNDIDRAAAKSGAPFIQSDVTLAAARSQWSHAFSAMNRLAALEDAMDHAKQALAAGAGAAEVMALKTERDSLRRAIEVRNHLGRGWVVLTPTLQFSGS